MILLGHAFGIDWLDAIIRLVILTLFMTVLVMFLTWLERKVAARLQQRLGPTRTGPIGLLQPVADAGKLLTKEDLRPSTADPWLFQLAVFGLFVPIFVSFIALPYTRDLWVRSLPLGLFFIVAMQSVSIVGILMAGWGSDSKYALVGAARGVAQMISYEIPLVLSVLVIAILSQSLDLITIVEDQATVPNIVWQPLAFGIFVVAVLAELGRQPFDMSVSESEVAGGFFIEYSGIRWSLFQLAEFANLFILSVFGSVLFLGGYAWPFGLDVGWPLQFVLTVIKASLMVVAIMWIRFSMPRLRIDQLMTFAWKLLIPLILVQVFLNGLVLMYDLPKIVLTISGLIILAAAGMTVRTLVRRTARSPRDQRLEAMRIRAARGLS
ncbi:MAG: NADH-quinone oxidoreductase subunit NuoH [Dehalococcoidia bacterium]